MKKFNKGLLCIALVLLLYEGFKWYTQENYKLCPACKKYIDISSESYVYCNDLYYHQCCPHQNCSYILVIKGGN